MRQLGPRRVVRPVPEDLGGGVPHKRVSGLRDGSPDTHPPHPQLGKLGDRRRPGPHHDIQWSGNSGNELSDHLGINNPRHKDPIRSGVKISQSPRDRLFWTTRTQQKRVNPSIDEKVVTASGPSRGDPPGLGVGAVLDIHPDSPGRGHLPHGGRHIPVPTLDIGGNRHVNRTNNTSDNGHGVVGVQPIPVRHPETPGDPGTGGGNGLGPGLLNDPSTGGIPDVGQDKRFARVMTCTKVHGATPPAGDPYFLAVSGHEHDGVRKRPVPPQRKRQASGMQTHTVMDSPVGPLTLVATDGTLSGLYMDEQRHRPLAELFGPRDDTKSQDVKEQLRAYFAGTLTTFTVPLALKGTDFQRQVWTELRQIPYGETTTYGELAERMGRPTAARAVGLANGKNPISIIVPCHRVIGSTGNLTGYGGGLPRKRYLLDFERGVPALL